MIRVNCFWGDLTDASAKAIILETSRRIHSEASLTAVFRFGSRKVSHEIRAVWQAFSKLTAFGTRTWLVWMTCWCFVFHCALSLVRWICFQKQAHLLGYFGPELWDLCCIMSISRFWGKTWPIDHDTNLCSIHQGPQEEDSDLQQYIQLPTHMPCSQSVSACWLVMYRLAMYRYDDWWLSRRIGMLIGDGSIGDVSVWWLVIVTAYWYVDWWCMDWWCIRMLIGDLDSLVNHVLTLLPKTLSSW